MHHNFSSLTYSSKQITESPLWGDKSQKFVVALCFVYLTSETKSVCWWLGWWNIITGRIRMPFFLLEMVFDVLNWMTLRALILRINPQWTWACPVFGSVRFGLLFWLTKNGFGARRAQQNDGFSRGSKSRVYAGVGISGGIGLKGNPNDQGRKIAQTNVFLRVLRDRSKTPRIRFFKPRVQGFGVQCRGTNIAKVNLFMNYDARNI